MKTQTKNPAVVVNIPGDIKPLGCAVRVTYVPATNHRPSRWKAEIDDGKFKAKAFAPYSYDGLENQHFAVVSCLEKWAATFETSPPDFIVLHSKGWDGNAALYFFTVNR
jgi:hypothetical protein